MSWFRRNVSSSSDGNDFTDQQLRDFKSDGCRVTREVERTTCEAKQVNRGKVSRKCEISKEIHLHCVGKPYRVVQTNTVYAEDELTSLPQPDDDKPPELERQMKSLLGAAQEMKSSIFKTAT